MRSMEEAEQRLARFANDRHTFISSGANAFECRTNASLDFVVAAHKDLVKRIDDSAKPNLLTARGHLRNQGREALPKLGVPSYYW